jgi:hypothetical protein
MKESSRRRWADPFAPAIWRAAPTPREVARKWPCIGSDFECFARRARLQVLASLVHLTRDQLPSAVRRLARRILRCWLAFFRDLDNLIPPLLVGLDHLIDVEILYASKKQRKAINPLLHDLHNPAVSGSSERRIGVSDTLSGYRGPAIDASNSTVSLYGPDRAWIQFIVDEMPAIAMQIDPFRELMALATRRSATASGARDVLGHVSQPETSAGQLAGRSCWSDRCNELPRKAR